MSTWKIDWDDMMTGFNRIYGTKYRDAKTFLNKESKKLGIQGLAEKLGVCGPSINRIKKKFEIANQKLVWKSKRKKVLELAKAGKTKNMTVLEISEYAGYLALNTVYNMAKEEGFEFKRRWKKKVA